MTWLRQSRRGGGGQISQTRKAKTQKQSEKPRELKRKAIEDREMRLSIFSAGCITAVCGQVLYPKSKEDKKYEHEGLIAE